MIGAVCIPNISARERRKRLIGAGVQLTVGLLLLGALMISGADRWWRIALLVPFWGAAAGYFQWRDRT